MTFLPPEAAKKKARANEPFRNLTKLLNTTNDSKFATLALGLHSYVYLPIYSVSLGTFDEDYTDALAHCLHKATAAESHVQSLMLPGKGGPISEWSSVAASQSLEQTNTRAST